MGEITPWTKRLIIVGILVISILSLVIDSENGSDLAMIGVAGLLGVIRGD